MAKEFKFAELRRKLTTGERPLATELTGDCLGRMLQELEQGRQIKTPYKIIGEKLAEECAVIGRKLREVLEEAERLWDFAVEGPSESNAGKSIQVENKTISAVDLEALDAQMTHLTIKECSSNEWEKIG